MLAGDTPDCRAASPMRCTATSSTMGLDLQVASRFPMMPLQPEPLFRKTTMSAQCTDHCHTPTASADPRSRRILWIALLVNAAMFVVELGAGLSSGSASLLADAIDFLGDAANYGVSLLVLAMALQWRARAALLKGASMLAFGVFVIGRVAWGAWQGITPEALTMGSVGLLAL